MEGGIDSSVLSSHRIISSFPPPPPPPDRDRSREKSVKTRNPHLTATAAAAAAEAEAVQSVTERLLLFAPSGEKKAPSLPPLKRLKWKWPDSSLLLSWPKKVTLINQRRTASSFCVSSFYILHTIFRLRSICVAFSVIIDVRRWRTQTSL